MKISVTGRSGRMGQTVIAAIETEADPALKAQKQRLERLLTLRFDAETAARVAAINSFGADLGLDLRGALNPLLAVKRAAAAQAPGLT